MAKERPQVNSEGQRELDKAQAQVDAFEASVKEITMDRANALSKKEDTEPQTKMSQKDIAESKDTYIRPSRSIGGREKFNEDYRDEWTKAKEFVHIIAEHKEIQGETLEFWTKPYPGVPAEFWQVPVNKPVWVPRYVNERIQACYYHRMHTTDKPTNMEGGMTYYGSMVVDSIVQRLDSREVSGKRSFYMGLPYAGAKP